MPAPAPRSCPICGDDLVAQPITDDLGADVCAEHGVWLGDGELDELQHRAGVLGSRGALRRTVRAVRRAYRRGLQDGATESGFADFVRGLLGFGSETRARRRRRAQVRRNVDEATEPGMEHGNDALVPPGERRCPVCAEVLAVEHRKDVWTRGEPVEVDRCAAHGVWLDRGELEVLLHRARRGRSLAARGTRNRIVGAEYDRGVADGRGSGLDDGLS